jgi:hypothetical protein
MSPGKRGQWGEDVLRHRWTLGGQGDERSSRGGFGVSSGNTLKTRTRPSWPTERFREGGRARGNAEARCLSTGSSTACHDASHAFVAKSPSGCRGYARPGGPHDTGGRCLCACPWPSAQAACVRVVREMCLPTQGNDWSSLSVVSCTSHRAVSAMCSLRSEAREARVIASIVPGALSGRLRVRSRRKCKHECRLPSPARN